jgi:hypothetical protein
MQLVELCVLISNEKPLHIEFVGLLLFPRKKRFHRAEIVTGTNETCKIKGKPCLSMNPYASISVCKRGYALRVVRKRWKCIRSKCGRSFVMRKSHYLYFLFWKFSSDIAN